MGKEPKRRGGGSREDVRQLIAKKKYTQAIEILREQLNGPGPVAGLRMQLGDLLVQTGRGQEAIPVFLALADELAADGFIARAVAALKRVDKIELGRPEVEARLTAMGRRTPSLPPRPAATPPAEVSSTFEIGIEEVGSDTLSRLEAAAAERAARGEASPSPDDAGLPAVPEASALEALVVDAPAEPPAEPVAAPPETAAPEPEVAAPATTAPPMAEPESATSGEAESGGADAVASQPPAGEPPGGAAGEEAAIAPAIAEPAETQTARPATASVAGRLRGVFRRFLAALPVSVPDARPDASEPEPEPGASAPEAIALGPDALEFPPEAITPSPDASAPTSGNEPPPESEQPDLVSVATEAVAAEPGAIAAEPLAIPPAEPEAPPHPEAATLAPESTASAPEPAPTVSPEPTPEAATPEPASESPSAFALVPDTVSPEPDTLSPKPEAAANEPVAAEPVPAAPPESATADPAPEFDLGEPEPALAEGEDAALEQGLPTLDLPDEPASQTAPAPTVEDEETLPTLEVEEEATPVAAEAAEPVDKPELSAEPEALVDAEKPVEVETEVASPEPDTVPIPVAAVIEPEALVEVEPLPVEPDALEPEALVPDPLVAEALVPDAVMPDALEPEAVPLVEPDVSNRRVPPRTPDIASFLSLTEDAFQDQVTDLIEGMLDLEDMAAASDGPPEHARPLLTGPLFEGLADDERVALVRGLRLRTFEPGDILLTEGEAGSSLFLITAGAAKVFVRNPAGHNLLLDSLGEGDFFGEISTLHGRPRTATVSAAAPCELLELDQPALAQIAVRYPHVAERLEAFSRERAGDPEAAALRIRESALNGEGVLGRRPEDGRLDPRMRLRLAEAFLKAGQEREAAQVLIELADDLVRRGQGEKAVALLKKVEQLQRRPKGWPRPLAPTPSAANRPSDSDDRLGHWLVDVVRDTVRRRQAVAARTLDVPAGAFIDEETMHAYGRGLVTSPLFAGLSREELLALLQGLEFRMFEPGDLVLTEGEPGRSVFVIARGEVRLFVRNRAGHDLSLRTLGEGAFFGEISALSGRSRTATVTATTSCVLLELDHAPLESIVAAHPVVREKLETAYIERAGDPVAEAIRRQ
jgi:CRP-like cAMP-binding protein